MALCTGRRDEHNTEGDGEREGGSCDFCTEEVRLGCLKSKAEALKIDLGECRLRHVAEGCVDREAFL